VSILIVGLLAVVLVRVLTPPKRMNLRRAWVVQSDAPPSTPQPTQFTPPTQFIPTFGMPRESFANPAPDQNQNPAVLANGKGVNWGFGGPGNFWWYPQAKCTSNWECGYGTCNASGFCV